MGTPHHSAGGLHPVLVNPHYDPILATRQMNGADDRTQSAQSVPQRVVQSALFLIYLCKVIVLPFILIDDLRRIAVWIMGLVSLLNPPSCPVALNSFRPLG